MFDIYQKYIFRPVSEIIAGIFSLFPISVGEIGIIVTVIGLLLWMILCGIHMYLSRIRKKPGKLLSKIVQTTGKIFIGIGIWVLLTEVFFCFLLYHTTTLEEKYFDGVSTKEDTLLEVYEYCVSKANRLSGEVERNDKMEAVYMEGDRFGSDYQNQQKKQCIREMKRLSDTYAELKGYYPNAKAIYHSDFMSQQYLEGIYFPFTMEANYNRLMNPVQQPATICHELSHIKGVIREDEANFLAFVSCVESDEIYVQYSGYLSVIPYLVKEIRRTLPAEERKQLQTVNDTVKNDLVFLSEADWQKVEENAVVKTETVNKATDAFLENNLKMNGVKNGMESYSEVVRLLVKWYEQEKKEKKN